MNKVFTLLNGVECEITAWDPASMKHLLAAFKEGKDTSLPKAVFEIGTLQRLGDESNITLETLTKLMVEKDFMHLLMMSRLHTFRNQPEMPVELVWKDSKGRDQKYLHRPKLTEKDFDIRYSKKVLEKVENRLYMANPDAEYYNLKGCSIVQGIEFGNEFLVVKENGELDLLLFENGSNHYQLLERLEELQEFTKNQKCLYATDTILPVYESYKAMLLDSTFSFEMADKRQVSMQKLTFEMMRENVIKNPSQVDYILLRKPKVNGEPTMWRKADGFEYGDTEFATQQIGINEGWFDDEVSFHMNPFTRQKQLSHVRCMQAPGFFMPSAVGK